MKLRVIKFYDVENPAVNQIVSYLHSIGYTKTLDTEGDGYIALMNPSTKIVLEVPAKEEFLDYERRLQELFDDLARIQDKDTLGIWSDIVDFRAENG